MSVAGGFEKAIDRALSVESSALQIFVKNNMQWFAPPMKEAEWEAFQRHPRRRELRSVFAHSGYLINLAAVNPDFREKSIRALQEELIRADHLELPFLVLHPGSHMGAGEEAGLAAVAEALDEVFDAIPQVKSTVALECTAGQGSALGYKFEHLRSLLRRSRHGQRLKVCLDTAHLFAAGYDLSSEASTGAVFEEFGKKIGWRRLVAIHCNDSKTGLGSRVDRHEAIGKGKIGLPAFRYVMNEPRLATVPKVLETPKGKTLEEDRMNMETLRSLL